MKKLGICVCYQHRNYGSQLQSYATVAELERRGVDYEIIRYKKKITPGFVLRSLPRLANPVFLTERVKTRYKKNLMLKTHPQLAKDNAVRNARLASFSNERFKKLSPVFCGYDELKRGALKYDAVMVGSDQLWSPGGITSNFYNLMFAPDDTVKISYAASFGVSNIKEKLRPLYRAFLDRMDYISVRENSGRELVEALSSQTAEVVVDPVLLLTAEDWLREIPQKSMSAQPYIFAFLLGPSAEYREAVSGFAKAKGLKIITSRHMDTFNKADEDFGDEAPFDVGPAEFVNLIRGAEYVFTDSFHGSVFSMLYNKRLMIFNRSAEGDPVSKNSRIDSLCANYGLEDRRYKGDIGAVEKPVDWEAVMKKVKKHREESLRFLDKALE